MWPAYFMAGYLGRAAGPDRLLDPVRQLLQRILVDGSTLAGAPDAADHLVPAEDGSVTPLRLTTASTASFDRGEPAAALGAEATAAGGLPVVDLRVDHAAVRVPRERTTHRDLPTGTCWRPRTPPIGEQHECNHNM